MSPLSVVKKRSFRVAIACLSLLIAVSMSTQAAPAQIKSGGGKHCLWQVKNAKAPFYLLGSIHRLRDSDYPLPSTIDAAIAQSNVFYFETDPNHDGDMMQRLENASKLPRGVEIKERVHQKTWDYLRTGARGGSFDWVHLKAWGIAMFLLDYPMHMRVSGAYGVDYYVEKKARARNCSMRGLESLDAHIAVFGGMSDIESEAYLLEAIVYADHRESEMRDIIAAWKTGNIEKLAIAQCSLDPGHRKRDQVRQANNGCCRRDAFQRTEQRDRDVARARIRDRTTLIFNPILCFKNIPSVLL
ncbi:MAG: hypothetical protein DME57_03490 [Verrucomicrobia bacterium]|nr:MAG: hypothetical protein DME57_03490 [Verrucomicrobiota bacterium]